MQYSNSEDEYKYESDNDYSTDSSDENYCTQRILKLGLRRNIFCLNK